ncbi:hypothetical protein [Allosalinactinospora lopnorensis]|uniref:hypothetical protein n=1 Tax=Allosalinactinospora lopnorensis TaxID=1352348 RepID=UPI000623C6E8|nr:hypothetical protein [Allosalinactinospora lopnorensis]
MTTPQQHARHIATAITQAWDKTYGPSRFEVPMSVAASICLLRTVPQEDKPERVLEESLPQLPTPEFINELWARWGLSTDLWPELSPRWTCLSEWMPGISPTIGRPLAAGARSVAAACIEAGLPELIDDANARSTVDALGHILHSLYAQVYAMGTDPLLSQAPALDAQRIAALHPGATLTLLQVWSGTRIMHIATRLRQRGIDPASLTWQLRVIDELAAAVLATNCVLWGIDRSAVIGISDDDQTWLEEAHHERTAALLGDFDQS